MVAGSVAVCGTIAATPHQGGAAWAVLQYLLGLRGLGWEVAFVEVWPHTDEPEPAGARVETGVRYLRSVAEQFGLGDRWAVFHPGGKVSGSRPVADAVGSSDLLVDVAGMAWGLPQSRERAAQVPIRLYLDLDPGFVQLWHADGIEMHLDGHTHFATLGDRIGTDGSPIPDCGRSWIATLPPVVLDRWPIAEQRPTLGLTTVGNWRSYGAVRRGSIRYGVKAHTARALAELPTMVDVAVEPALAIHADEVEDLAWLRRHGWSVAQPADVADTPDRYASFVRRSWAEIGIAKEGYAVGDTGWFSDRSACYLASGRPVIALDTGFGRRVPTGHGLLAFDDVAGAADAVRRVASDYPGHRAAARAIAEEFLDADVVLGALLDSLS